MGRACWPTRAPPAPPKRAALKKFLKKHVVDEELAVIDKKLGGIVQEKLGIPCIYRCASEGARQ